MNSFWSKLISAVTHTLLNELKKNQSKDQTDIATATDDNDSNNIGFAQDKISHISPAGVELICNFEGLSLEAYLDSANIWTIGYGTTIYPNGQRVSQNDQCTLKQAQEFMLHDLQRFEKAVARAVQVSVNQNQFDALVSLTYNIGISAFQSSTLLKYLNAVDFKSASDQFDVWIKSGGKTVQGLVNRRAIEKAKFLS
ncbi:lysozyme [Acinetobacter sichuanensis]|uniref:Lysozyme n=1 Tax=Acinetobacter sichuanensis TaxID=2136183 RepID=A0A371YRM4_9GAMM|nr:lysozyme [Acinetobacter sichuanensis]RFC84102.1 lysozyme [Acinetobacter sichuanensis]